MLSIKERNPNTIQNPEADTKILFNDATDGKLKTKDSAGTIEEVALVDATAPKVYVALLTQSGTNVPVATVLQNTLGGTVVWSRGTAGEYHGTLAGSFIENKTTPIDLAQRGGYDGFNSICGSRGTDNIYTLRTCLFGDLTSYSDDVLNSTLIKIEVYP